MAQLSDCCTRSIDWTGTPVGTESTLAGVKAYVTGDNKEVAILYIADIMGWTYSNNRLHADTFAKEANAIVYVPDFYAGEVVQPGAIQKGELNVSDWLSRNAPAKREASLLECAKILRSQYKRVVAVGYCYGGWASFKLGEKGSELIDALSIAHPTFVTHEHIAKVGVPVQLLAPQDDPMFTEPMKAYFNHIMPTLGLTYEYLYFPGMHHGFTTKSDVSDQAVAKAVLRAKNAQVAWAIQFLHN